MQSPLSCFGSFTSLRHYVEHLVGTEISPTLPAMDGTTAELEVAKRVVMCGAGGAGGGEAGGDGGGTGLRPRGGGGGRCCSSSELRPRPSAVVSVAMAVGSRAARHGRWVEEEEADARRPRRRGAAPCRSPWPQLRPQLALHQQQP
jgi:hypothetical protein